MRISDWSSDVCSSDLGTVRLLNDVHGRFGKADWAGLFDPAIRLATEGFEVSPRLAKLVAAEGDRLKTYEGAAQYFFDEAGAPLQAGSVLRNQAYADTLAAIASGGADAFYTGPIAEAIERTVREASGNPGVLQLSDLAN